MLIIGVTHFYINGISATSHSIENLIGLGVFVLTYAILFILPNGFLLKAKWAQLTYIVFMIPPAIFIWTIQYDDYLATNNTLTQLSEFQMHLGKLGISLYFIIPIVSLLLAVAASKLQPAAVKINRNDQSRIEPTISINI